LLEDGRLCLENQSQKITLTTMGDTLVFDSDKNGLDIRLEFPARRLREIITSARWQGLMRFGV
jgi:hypothetical protein